MRRNKGKKLSKLKAATILPIVTGQRLHAAVDKQLTINAIEYRYKLTAIRCDEATKLARIRNGGTTTTIAALHQQTNSKIAALEMCMARQMRAATTTAIVAARASVVQARQTVRDWQEKEELENTESYWRRRRLEEEGIERERRRQDSKTALTTLQQN